MGNACSCAGGGRRRRIRDKKKAEANSIKTDSSGAFIDLTSAVFNNSMLMENIAQNLSPAHLMELRRTCTIWGRNLVPVIKRNHEAVVLMDGNVAYSPNSIARARKGRPVGDFVDLIRSSLDFPFASYEVYPAPGYARTREDTDRSNFLQLVFQFGSTIKTLRLRWTSWTRLNGFADLSFNQLRQIIFEWTPQLVELELEITLTPLMHDEDAATEAEKLELQTKLSPPPSLLLLPSLKRLKLKAGIGIGMFYNSPASPAFTQLMLDVIRCAEGLQIMDICDRHSSCTLNDGFGPTLAGLLINVNSVVNPANLKTLKLTHSSPSIADLQNLIELTKPANRSGGAGALHLRAFSVCVKSHNLPGHSHDLGLENRLSLLAEFLATQASSLTQLEICFHLAAAERQAVLSYLPDLPNLKSLNFLQGYVLYAPQLEERRIVAGSPTFQDAYPKLESISDKIDMYRENVPKLGDELFHSGVTSLEASPVDFPALSRTWPLFPSLTRLKLHWRYDQHRYGVPVVGVGGRCRFPNNETFSSIWTMWPALTVLHLHIQGLREEDEGMNMDEFVTGIPAAELELLKHFDSSLLATPPKDMSPLNVLRDMADERKIWPGIGDLNQLKSFTITFKSFPDPDYNPQLSDMGGYFGVALASPTLQQLVINGSGKNLVSEQCGAFIRRAFGCPVAVIDL